MLGFTAADHMNRRQEYLGDFGRWLRTGEITDSGNILDGLERAPQALCDALAGRYVGRVAIRLP